MKGVIFTELLNFVESKGGAVFLEDVIEHANLPNNGAFSTVGTYPSEYASALVKSASDLSSIPAQQLCLEYGEFLFHRFTILYPELLASYHNADGILSHVGTHIHQEVKLLDPEAQPPQVSTREEDGALIIEYQSHRPFAHIAHGLIIGALAHYKDGRKLLAIPSDDPSRATFKVIA